MGVAMVSTQTASAAFATYTRILHIKLISTLYGNWFFVLFFLFKLKQIHIDKGTGYSINIL